MSTPSTAAPPTFISAKGEPINLTGLTFGASHESLGFPNTVTVAIGGDEAIYAHQAHTDRLIEGLRREAEEAMQEANAQRRIANATTDNAKSARNEAAEARAAYEAILHANEDREAVAVNIAAMGRRFSDVDRALAILTDVANIKLKYQSDALDDIYAVVSEPKPLGFFARLLRRIV